MKPNKQEPLKPTKETDSAQESGAEVKDWKDVIIVTDPFHCRRAMTMANDLGVVATCSPVKTGPNSLEKSGKRYLVRETGAYLAYVTLGRRGIHISDHLG